MKKNIWILSLVLICSVAFGAGTPQKFQTDDVRMGKSSSTADKVFTFDTGDGGSNAKISVDNATQSFNLNKNTKVKGNSLSVGDGSASDKSINFDNGSVNPPKIKWNDVDVALEYANDGLNFKKIGSGSGGGGGGVNLLGELNADFEAGTPPSNWTASGGTFLAETTSPLFDKKSAAWNASGMGQTLTSEAKVINLGMIGRTCSADIYYKYPAGTTGDYKIQAYLNGSTLITESDIQITSGDNVGVATTAFFDCPSVGTDTLNIVIISNVADPDVITLDNAFIGSDKNVGFGTPQDVFSAKISSTGVVSGENLDWISGNCAMSGTGSSTGLCNLVTPTSSIMTCVCDVEDAVSAASKSCNINYAGSSTTSIQYYVNINAILSARNVSISCQKAESSANRETITVETSGWNIEAGINGITDTITSGTKADIVSSSFTMVPATGSAPVGIPCSTTNDNNVGNYTCSAGDEVFGFIANFPKSGMLNVCYGFTYNALSSVGSGNTLYVTSTASNSDTILYESVITQFYNFGNQYQFGPGYACRNVYVTAGKGAIRIKNTYAGSGTTVNSFRSLSISAKYDNEQVPAPVFTELQNVTKGASSGKKIYSAVLNCDAGSAITSQDGTWISAISNIASGQCDITIAGGIFAATPRCFVTPNTRVICKSSEASATSANVNCMTDAGVNATAIDFNYMCFGN